MREVIQRVLATEAEAKGIVAAARAEAERILSEARQQSQDLVARVRQEARTEVEQMLAAALKEGNREKAERLARLATEIEAGVQLDGVARQHAVAGAVRCVCRLPW